MSDRKTKALIYFTALSAGTLLISNLSAIKLWDLFGIPVDGGIVLFPLSYILGDLIIEFFGLKTSKTIIYAGFTINLIAVFVFYAVIALPAYPGWDMQDAFAMVLGFSPRIILGSLCGFLSSSLLNNYLFVKMKESDGFFAKSFIARALGSSVVAHIVDSAVFETIAFLGVLSFPEFMKQMIFAYLLGLLLETILAPVEHVIQKHLEKKI
ncbi:queuosine precursor transporter [Ileibacterium valens]|uniref:Probable queuosine precursor transporter n=3 Tax=Ileibacterium valens TaxID=1862668 RepID=A0A1U7NIX6_9FIRM|nr:queuosine precursor transporter [Ileibacterium valens]OLU40616.1 hypothetical protein BO224_05160 [Erysipelotrichaceae bacterium NYU-BL-E8]OLU42772.1 hypothetical protein BM735_01665 [Erysipelotrichaceae bacterium NYU-BL-F16]OLU42816.1 hypothetical protein BO222_00995 [Ileibacterium valens]